MLYKIKNTYKKNLILLFIFAYNQLWKIMFHFNSFFHNGGIAIVPNHKHYDNKRAIDAS
jgi:hypothetical protein